MKLNHFSFVLIASFMAITFIACEKDAVITEEPSDEKVELLAWLEENAELMDANFVEKDGTEGCLYETYVSKQKIFIPTSSNSKTEPESYTKAVDYGPYNVGCAGPGNCCGIATYGDGVTIRINPDCLGNHIEPGQ